MKSIKDRLWQIPFFRRHWRLARWFINVLNLLILLPKYFICRIKGCGFLWWEYEFNKLFHDSQILQNVNRVKDMVRLKRALLIYIINPFLESCNVDASVSHTNRWRSRELVRILDEIGYVVDVMKYSDYNSKISFNYDLLLGFGRAEELAKEFPQSTIKIRLATGSEANFHNKRERERIEEVNKRRYCSLQGVRRNTDNSELIRYFDAIACLGNEVTADTYRPFSEKKIYCFNNHGYDQWIGSPEGKDFAESRQNFLFFGSAGQVLFGLDLLLEVFASKPNLRLYVCGPFEKEELFVECYRKELYKAKNIVPVGWVTVGSPEYFDLTRKCGMVIVPICSGASTGSVVVCMGNGLIPIVTREAGIDTGDFGITLPSYKREDISSVVDWISSQPITWHEEMTLKVLDAASRDFSQFAFSKRFREILSEVIKDKTEVFCEG